MSLKGCKFSLSWQSFSLKHIFETKKLWFSVVWGLVVIGFVGAKSSIAESVDFLVIPDSYKKIEFMLSVEIADYMPDFYEGLIYLSLNEARISRGAVLKLEGEPCTPIHNASLEYFIDKDTVGYEYFDSVGSWGKPMKVTLLRGKKSKGWYRYLLAIDEWRFEFTTRDVVRSVHLESVNSGVNIKDVKFD